MGKNCRCYQQNPQTFAIWVSFPAKLSKIRNAVCTPFPILKSLWRYSCQNPISILWRECWSKFLTVTNFENFTSSLGKISQNKCDRSKRKVIRLRVTRKRIHFSNKRSNSNFADAFSSDQTASLWDLSPSQHHPLNDYILYWKCLIQLTPSRYKKLSRLGVIRCEWLNLLRPLLF